MVKPAVPLAGVQATHRRRSEPVHARLLDGRTAIDSSGGRIDKALACFAQT
jgi:hypothetical protein